MAYRIEDVADGNEILLPQYMDLAAYIWRQVQSFKPEQQLHQLLGEPAPMAPWSVKNLTPKKLKGIGDISLLSQTYRGST